MPDRNASITRKTRETEVTVELHVDGRGEADVDTGIGFLNHMLELLARHGLFDLKVYARGDLIVDAHHTVEDVAISLGKAFDQALGDRAGIARMGDATVPMDEALAVVAVDVGGRGYAVVETQISGSRLGHMEADMVRHFVQALAFESRMNINARVLAGYNDHHRVEALFKALARALDRATQIDPRRGGDIPSTKGIII